MKPTRCEKCRMRLRTTQAIHDITECGKDIAPAKVLQKKRERPRPAGRRTREQYFEDVRAKRKHGTRAMALAGCSCQPCKDAKNEYNREWKVKQKEKQSA